MTWNLPTVVIQAIDNDTDTDLVVTDIQDLSLKHPRLEKKTFMRLETQFLSQAASLDSFRLSPEYIRYIYLDVFVYMFLLSLDS